MWKKVFLVPILAGAFTFGTLVPVLFYCAGVFSITAHFMEDASHPMVYAVLCGSTCAFISAPGGESSVAGFYISVISYILFMTTMQVYGHAIAEVGMSLGGIVFVILIVFGILFTVIWLRTYPKIRERVLFPCVGKGEEWFPFESRLCLHGGVHALRLAGQICLDARKALAAA